MCVCVRVQELLARGETSESSIPAEPTQAPIQDSPDDTPKKKKKKKKDKIKEEEAEEDITRISAASELNGTTDDRNIGESGEKKKKKKKKEKRLKDEEEEVAVSRVEIHTSDSSGYISDKPSKKRKHESGNGSISGLGEDSTLTKPKKKRKADI